MIKASLLILISTIGISHAQDVSVQSLGQGACWVEESPEIVKLASFNDRQAVMTSREDIEYQLEDLVSAQNKKKSAKGSSGDLNLHCGGYGASVVLKTEVDNLPVCLWLKISKGKFEIRSMGGLEPSKDNLCDGYKWEELIVGVKSLDQKLVLEQDFKELIKSVTVVAGTTLKVTLMPGYRGREAEAQNILKKAMDLKYVELNLYQHPVGEVLPLK